MKNAPADALQQVNQRITNACQQVKRPNNSVTLLAVSKRHGIDKIRAVYASGQRHFGENYLNEALEKQQALTDLPIIWHYIGSIQSNKTRKIANHFAWVHTVDSLKIAERLSNQRPKDLPPLNICLQINIDNENSKSGLLPDTNQLTALVDKIIALPHLKLRGLMCIPELKADVDAQRVTFSRMQALQQTLQQHLQQHQRKQTLDTLSMGMSDDLDAAIACGATIVRVGTAIFGQRN